MHDSNLRIRISANGHYFQYADGTPFFYLADTAWLLFGKLRKEEIRELFVDRAAKGFTAIQAVVFRDLFEPNTPNAYGQKPFKTEADMYAVRMNPEWIAYVVDIVHMAAEYGLVMALLPTWGDKWHEHSNSAGPVIMDQNSGREYCRFLSDELAQCPNVIWVLGGDSPVQTQTHADTVRCMAEGIRSGKSGEQLVTYYPPGIGSSSIFHSEKWLDFNVLQTGHYKLNTAGYLHIERLFREPPPKPCMDMEANYEYMPMFLIGEPTNSTDLKTSQRPFAPAFSAYDVRKSLYRTALAGAAGYSYGCEPIRQVHRKGDRIHVWADENLPTWDEALSAPGSSQLHLLPEILYERKYTTREPAQELFIPLKQSGNWPDHLAITMDSAGQHNTDPASHISICRCTEGSYILAYMPVRQMLTLDIAALAGSRVQISLYNPESTELQYRYEAENNGTVLIVPERDLDTLIVVDSI